MEAYGKAPNTLFDNVSESYRLTVREKKIKLNCILYFMEDFMCIVCLTRNGDI